MANRIILSAVLALMASAAGLSQNWAVSSNVAGLADRGTLNATASRSVSKHWSMNAGIRYNPFSFPDDGTESGAVRKKQRMLTLGARYWLWHVYSGWWMSGAAQYQEYNFSKKGNNDTSEGDRIGAAFAAGYSYMLTPWLNVEFGLGFWGGYDRYKVYDCPTCGITVDRGAKAFLSPEDVIIALSIIF
ncbi:MAG: DUF3575 domain-containing protein [Bacteroidales bacterium]|nr:DUF3575 domain-containing protein [Bacteroidales bacterium]